jgi:hypothetical protein
MSHVSVLTHYAVVAIRPVAMMRLMMITMMLMTQMLMMMMTKMVMYPHVPLVDSVPKISHAMIESLNELHGYYEYLYHSPIIHISDLILSVSLSVVQVSCGVVWCVCDHTQEFDFTIGIVISDFPPTTFSNIPQCILLWSTINYTYILAYTPHYHA